MAKSPDAFRTISEVAEWLDVPTHVLRFWESRFTQIKPVKRVGGRRYYRPSDMELLGGIRQLLHDDGLTIRGVQKLLREEGVRHVAALSPALDGSDAGKRKANSGSPKDNVVSLSRKPDADDALDRWPFADDAPAPDGTGDAGVTPDAAGNAPIPPEPPAPPDTAVDTTFATAGPPDADAVDDDMGNDAVSDDPMPPDAADPSAKPGPAQAEIDTTPTDTASGAPAADPVSPPDPTELKDADPTRAPLPQPPSLDESMVRGPRHTAVAGLSALRRNQIETHRDTLTQVLDRAEALARAMGREDA